MRQLVKNFEVTVETPEPKKIKEALSRYKQEMGLPGILFFENTPAGFSSSGEILFNLKITYAQG